MKNVLNRGELTSTFIESRLVHRIRYFKEIVTRLILHDLVLTFVFCAKMPKYLKLNELSHFVANDEDK